jgi:predicted GNAT family acetyltransferase
VARDEILEAVVRDELRGQGLEEDEADEAIAAMRDQGMFDVPDWELR